MGTRLWLPLFGTLALLFGGLGLLPPCQVHHGRFNDGGYSQVRRDRVDPRFGTLADFERLIAEHPEAPNAFLNHAFAHVDKIPVEGAISCRGYRGSHVSNDLRRLH